MNGFNQPEFEMPEVSLDVFPENPNLASEFYNGLVQ